MTQCKDCPCIFFDPEGEPPCVEKIGKLQEELDSLKKEWVDLKAWALYEGGEASALVGDDDAWWGWDHEHPRYLNLIAAKKWGQVEADRLFPYEEKQ